jgi:hypothetical protein
MVSKYSLLLLGSKWTYEKISKYIKDIDNYISIYNYQIKNTDIAKITLIDIKTKCEGIIFELYECLEYDKYLLNIQKEYNIDKDTSFNKCFGDVSSHEMNWCPSMYDSLYISLTYEYSSQSEIVLTKIQNVKNIINYINKLKKGWYIK